MRKKLETLLAYLIPIAVMFVAWVTIADHDLSRVVTAGCLCTTAILLRIRHLEE
jgi:hypothetical protein